MDQAADPAASEKSFAYARASLEAIAYPTVAEEGHGVRLGAADPAAFLKAAHRAAEELANGGQEARAAFLLCLASLVATWPVQILRRDLDPRRRDPILGDLRRRATLADQNANKSAPKAARVWRKLKHDTAIATDGEILGRYMANLAQRRAAERFVAHREYRIYTARGRKTATPATDATKALDHRLPRRPLGRQAQDARKPALLSHPVPILVRDLLGPLYQLLLEAAGNVDRQTLREEAAKHALKIARAFIAGPALRSLRAGMLLDLLGSTRTT